LIGHQRLAIDAIADVPALGSVSIAAARLMLQPSRMASVESGRYAAGNGWFVVRIQQRWAARLAMARRMRLASPPHAT